MKIKHSDDLVRYSFKGPGWGRKTFTIYVDIKTKEGKRNCKKIDDERLDAINKSFSLQLQSLEQCTVQIKEIILDLYKKDSRCVSRFTSHNKENFDVLERYWNEHYKYRTLVDEYTAKNELKNSISLLGSLSIYSASRAEIQNAIDKKHSGNYQRRMVQRLLQLLKFIGRTDVQLRKQPQKCLSVTYLNESDFKKVLLHVPTEIERSLLRVCYYSGLRIGEAYALEPHHLLANGTIRVTAQIDRNGKRRHTKTKKLRIAYLCTQGLDSFKYWSNAKADEKSIIDRNEASRDLMKKYCKLAFPDDPAKHLTFHALRHCYAINLLTKGVSMSLVAQSLGNTLSVCQQYYVGFELTNEAIEAIQSIVSKNS